MSALSPAADEAVVELRSWLTAGGRAAREVRARVFDLGLAWPHFPVGDGGLGLTPAESSVVTAQLRLLGIPATHPSSVIAVDMAAPTLVAHGGPHHRQLLRRIYVERDLWCQFFSEPGAGSDLANVSTSARRDGDHWVVNGTKVWTSLAHEARWAMLLARTDPGLPKHRGLTFFVVALDTPGITVRPLYQITGEAEFNEVLLDEVAVPDADRLGDVGQGWSVALTTLSSERSALSNVQHPGARPLDRAMRLWKDSGNQNPADRARLVDLWVRDQLVTATLQRTADAADAAFGPMNKVLWAELHQDTTEFSLRLLGSDVLEYPRGYPMTRPDIAAEDTECPGYDYLRSRATSIEGGTSEILRNLVGERVLGLEPEPRVDKSVPWRETRRG